MIPAQLLPVHLHLCGRVTLGQTGDSPVAFSCNRSVALLGLLAANPGPRLREQLAEMLWPNSAEAARRHSLRQALHNLNKVVGSLTPAALVATRNAIELRSDVLVSDVSLLLATEPPMVEIEQNVREIEQLRSTAIAV